MRWIYDILILIQILIQIIIRLTINNDATRKMQRRSNLVSIQRTNISILSVHNRQQNIVDRNKNTIRDSAYTDSFVQRVWCFISELFTKHDTFLSVFNWKRLCYPYASLFLLFSRSFSIVLRYTFTIRNSVTHQQLKEKLLWHQHQRVLSLSKQFVRIPRSFGILASGKRWLRFPAKCSRGFSSVIRLAVFIATLKDVDLG